MNFKKFINSDYLKETPLCGIDTYKDELNLATGACTRQIKKLVLTGNELWGKSGDGIYAYFGFRLGDSSSTFTTAVCTHYENVEVSKTSPAVGFMLTSSSRNLRIRTNDVENVTLNDFVSFLTQQYANGTPVTVWYVLAEPETETITVPSGLSGTEEGYLIQEGTPTATNPIYPTANTVEKWFDLKQYIYNASTQTWSEANVKIYQNGAWTDTPLAKS